VYFRATISAGRCADNLTYKNKSKTKLGLESFHRIVYCSLFYGKPISAVTALLVRFVFQVLFDR